MADGNASIVRKAKKGGHGAHRGGAWKAAYGDFATAMIAFFLLMALIAATAPGPKRGIADYFTPQSADRAAGTPHASGSP